MNREQLMDAIGNAKAEYLEQSEHPRKRKPNGWKIAALAACACLAIGLAGFALLVFTPAGSSAPAQDMESSAAESPADGGSGSGSDRVTADGASLFLSYSGPVLPLTLAGENDAITAERNITLDFDPYGITDEEHLDCCRNLLVTDEYLLTNFSDTDQTVTVRYPYVSSFRDRWERDPDLTVDGVVAKATVAAGNYVGGYYTIDPNMPDREGERWNIKEPQSWEDYQFLADDAYQYAAFAEPSSTDLPVTTYAFTDLTAPENVSAATLGLKTSYDESKTTVLTYNFNGQQWDEDTQQVIYDFFVNNAWRKANKPLTLLIVVGEDLPGFTIQGYEDGGCDKEIDGVSATVTRTETTLEQLMLDIARDHLEKLDYYDGHDHPTPTEDEIILFAKTLQTMLLQDGDLSDDPAERYMGAYMDDMIGDTHSRGRIFYLSADITIPAGRTVNVTASLTQPHSYNFFGSGYGNENVDGYDLVTTLGSNLIFTSQKATLENAQLVEIVNQNYGFDPENGVNTVELTDEHYYLEVQKLE